MEIVPQAYPLWAAVTVDGEFQAARVIAWRIYDGVNRSPVPVVEQYGQCALSGAEGGRSVPVLLATAGDQAGILAAGTQWAAGAEAE